MPRRRDYLFLRTGERREDIGRRESYTQIADRRFKQSRSDYPLRLLGVGSEKHVYISEEERYLNFHLLGAPGEGKSKFLEYHIRRDIEMDTGLCLIDPSEKGDTARNVLNYCAQINYKKVIVIDPALIAEYKKSPASLRFLPNPLSAASKA
jgi:hypothetical protein